MNLIMTELHYKMYGQWQNVNIHNIIIYIYVYIIYMYVFMYNIIYIYIYKYIFYALLVVFCSRVMSRKVVWHEMV